MKKIVFVLLLIFGFIQTKAQKADIKAVEQCFKNYKKAILNEEGEEAVKHLSKVTLDYYEQMLDYTLHADSNKLEELGVMDKFMVLALRHRTSVEDLRSFDGKRTIVYAIEKGMIGKSSVSRIEMGKIKIKDTKAEGNAVIGGKETPINFVFYKEDNAWKLDLTSIFPISEKGFEQLIENQDKSENDFLLGLLETITAIEPSASIWKPVGEN